MRSKGMPPKPSAPPSRKRAASKLPPPPMPLEAGGKRGAEHDFPAVPGGFPRIGISGWTYPPWRGVLYPKGLPQRRELHYASRSVNSIEINGSFYSLQKPESFREWFEQTPDDFVFSVKCPQYITHIKRLRGVEEAVANFYASGVLRLGAKLGPMLWQLPPNFKFAPEVLEEFLQQLPRTHAEAAEVARQHGARLKGRAWCEAEHRGPLRHALEVRHETFLCPEFFALLRQQKVAFVLADSGGKWPYAEDLTGDIVYVRLHGPEELYVSGYEEPVLDWWAARIALWAEGQQPADAQLFLPAGKARQMHGVYVYFDNDAKVRAPFDAMSLRRRFPLG